MGFWARTRKSWTPTDKWQGRSSCQRGETTSAKGQRHQRWPLLAVLAHRNTPTESMGTSPAQRLLGRRCKTQLPTTKELIKPQCAPAETVKRKMQAKQVRQALYYNRGTRDLSPLEEGAQVRMRPFRLGKRVWEQATVAKRHDERSYEVETEKGTYQRNRADLREQPTPQRSPQQTPPVQQPLNRRRQTLQTRIRKRFKLGPTAPRKHRSSRGPISK